MSKVHRILVLAAVCLFAFSLPVGETKTGLAQTPERPNIIFVLADDLDARSVGRMGRLKKLMADQGTTFENAFVTDSICCPSRATILSGKYAHNHGVLTNRSDGTGGFQKFRETGEEAKALPVKLQEAGYQTVHIGKYLNGLPDEPGYVPPGWDRWHAWVGGMKMNENGTVVRKEGYQTTVLRDLALTYLDNAAQSGQPFFMQIAHRPPHHPARPETRYENLWPDLKAPRTPSFNEEDVTDKPAWVAGRETMSEERIAQLDEFYRDRMRSMVSVNKMLGDVVAKLSEVGELDNTYLVFTSDNGWHQGQHRRAGGKWSAYEEDIRVPLMVRGPGVPAGQKREELVINNDLTPTMAEWTGAWIPEADGRSFVPLLSSETVPWREAFLVEAEQELGIKRPAYRALRTQTHLYVEYVTGEHELYDLTEDPYQLENRYATADPTLVAQLESQLEALQACAGADCRIAEDVPPGP